jgi:hypothetical protein
MNTNYAVLDVADEIYFCVMRGILIIKKFNKGGLILLVEK